MGGLLSPAVSVVLPTYNRADLLLRTVASILSQDFDDLELIVVDDGSDDETLCVVTGISDQRLRYIRLQENRGVGFARRTGLQYVSGTYVALADSDDLWLPGKLSAQVEMFEDHPQIEILFGDYLDIDHVSGTQEMGFAVAQRGMSCLTTHNLSGDLWIVDDGIEMALLRGSGFIATPTVMLRDSTLKSAGNFDGSLRVAEDFEFWWRVSVLGAQFAYIDRPLIERHKYRSSLTNSVVEASLQLLKALEACHQTCEAVQRCDLLKHIRATERRVCRRLVWEHGRDGQRTKAVRAFARSLRYGISLRNLFALTVALLGPRAVTARFRLRLGELPGLRGYSFTF
jgi:glycosyltransferase involved in cell wall biosynthesis